MISGSREKIGRRFLILPEKRKSKIPFWQGEANRFLAHWGEGKASDLGASLAAAEYLVATYPVRGYWKFRKAAFELYRNFGMFELGNGGFRQSSVRPIARLTQNLTKPVGYCAAYLRALNPVGPARLEDRAAAWAATTLVSLGAGLGVAAAAMNRHHDPAKQEPDPALMKVLSETEKRLSAKPKDPQNDELRARVRDLHETLEKRALPPSVRVGRSNLAQ